MLRRRAGDELLISHAFSSDPFGIENGLDRAPSLQAPQYHFDSRGNGSMPGGIRRESNKMKSRVQTKSFCTIPGCILVMLKTVEIHNGLGGFEMPVMSTVGEYDDKRTGHSHDKEILRYCELR